MELSSTTLKSYSLRQNDSGVTLDNSTLTKVSARKQSDIGLTETDTTSEQNAQKHHRQILLLHRIESKLL